MERPILFSTPMVQAILDGRKTQTRRIVKPQPTIEPHGLRWNRPGVKLSNGYLLFIGSSLLPSASDSPYGSVGDVLWVRETWNQDGNEFFYKADCDINVVGWKPSIHMPKKAARIWLEITKIRLERFASINEEDAKAEGVEVRHDLKYADRNDMTGYRDYGELHPDGKPYWYGSAIQSFCSLWKSINGESAIESNPWVWVIEFKRINK